MLIIISTKIERSSIGWRADFCRHCGQSRPFEVMALTEKKILYACIPVGTRPLGREQRCHVCEIDEVLRPDANLDVRWSPDLPLALLVEKTHPGLSLGPDHRALTPSDLDRILAAIQVRTRAETKKSGGAGLLFGIVIGLLVGGYLGALLVPNTATPWFVGGGLGAVIGVVLDYWIVARTTAKKLVKAALKKHHLSPGELFEVNRLPGKDYGMASKVVMKMTHP